MLASATLPNNVAGRISAKLTIRELIEALAAQRGATFVTIEARTDARLRKTGNPLGPVFKLSRVNGMVNWHYEAAVNRQREREGNAEAFEAFPRKWGMRVAGTPLVEHKGQTYVELKVERSLGHSYEDAAGLPLADEQVRPFLPAASSAADHQGVQREIILRDYNVQSIVAITMNGTRYEVEQAPAYAVAA